MRYKLFNLGLIDYNKAYFFQKKILHFVKSGIYSGAIILAEHLPVFTIGRSSSRDHFIIERKKIKSLVADIIRTDRGGDITFHGPGQVVAYPVFNLGMHGKDMHKFLRSIEEVIIRLLSGYNIESFRVTGRTGCWAGNGKIASIGIGASRWVSYHGMALNVNTDLKFFDMINPCGYDDIKMTSMQEILQYAVDIDNLKLRLIESFEKVFHIKTGVYGESFSFCEAGCPGNDQESAPFI